MSFTKPPSDSHIPNWQVTYVDRHGGTCLGLAKGPDANNAMWFAAGKFNVPRRSVKSAVKFTV